jgi:ligand-binding sensor domain-containing protein
MLRITIVFAEPPTGEPIYLEPGWLQVDTRTQRIELFRHSYCLITDVAATLFALLVEMAARKRFRKQWDALTDSKEYWVTKEKGLLYFDDGESQFVVPFLAFRDALQLALLALPKQ